MWTLAREASGQLRLGPGGERLGFDAAGFMALARGLSIPAAAVSVFLPALDLGLFTADRARRERDAAARESEGAGE